MAVRPLTAVQQFPESSEREFTFKNGFPTGETSQRAYDAADLNRAIEAYRFFYPTVSGAAILKGLKKVGIVPNRVFGVMETQPKHVGFTLNSDTPYAPLFLDLKDGPMVVEVPSGPIIAAMIDINQRWVIDMGVPGPDAGKGGKFLFLPPGSTEKAPAGYYVSSPSSNVLIGGIRSLPVGGDIPAAVARVKTVKVYPLHPTPGWSEPTWIDLTPISQDTTPVMWEDNIQYWKELAEAIHSQPAYEPYRNMYGELAVLGIEKGKPFVPDSRMTTILEKAAKIANAQMRVESFGDRRADRIVWPDRKWEWVALRFENGDFNTANYADLYARDKWFYQAIAVSPAMFRRSEGAGSLYWLGLRDESGAPLDGGKTYKLVIPQPVPYKLFWSVTVYDTHTRSQVQTELGKAALRSLFELKDVPTTQPTELYFGPNAPAGQERYWIKTIRGKGWFAYVRIYGPEKPAFDGSWRPDDFKQIK